MKKRIEVKPCVWWGSLSYGERLLFWSVMRVLRSAKQSQVLDVSRAAAKWEQGIGYFIKVRLIRQRHLFFLTDDNYNSPSDMNSSV